MEASRDVVAEVLDAAGGGASLAKRLSEHLHKPITRQAVYQWTRVPAEHVITVEKITGIPRHRQRPDIFPDPATEPERQPQ